MLRKTIIITILILVLGSLFAQRKPKTLPMAFDNPGNRRILKTETSNHYYYRSLPERSMNLNVKGIDKIALRSFAIEPIKKPQVIFIVNKKRTTVDLELDHRLNGYYMYKAVDFTIPEGTESLEILCYHRSIYFRSFYTVAPVPKPKKIRIPNMRILTHAGAMYVNHNADSKEYYGFDRDQSLVFELNNARNATVYVRARLTDRSVPSFDLYHNGEKIQSYEFTLKRSTKYKVNGIRHLSVGIKVELPQNSNSGKYELRASSEHLFLARPVLLKSTSK